MQLILISNFFTIPQEHYLLNLLFCEGLETFHLRKKNFEQAEMEKYIERIPREFHNRIMIHSHFDLVEKYQLKGAHFTKMYTYEDYLLEFHPNSSPNQKLFPVMSFSLHSIQEAREIESIYDYIFLSPIFDSISNTGYNSKFRINDLKLFLSKKENRSQVIALSGITEDKVGKIHEIGFDGLALLGHIWRIYEEDQNLLAAVERFKTIQNLIQFQHKSNGAAKPVVGTL